MKGIIRSIGRLFVLGIPSALVVLTEYRKHVRSKGGPPFGPLREPEYGSSFYGVEDCAHYLRSVDEKSPLT